MASTEETLNKFYEAYGKQPEGYDDFLKSCKVVDPFLNPTRDSKLCKGYEVHPGLRLHNLMIQPFYESRTMKMRPTDVIVASYPKTGTTWTQEICYLIVNDVDLKKANSAVLEERIPFIEAPPMGVKGIEKTPDPRVIKTHLSYGDLPPSILKNKTKIVYIVRNPKDTLVSFYFFLKMLGYMGYAGTMEDFLNMFVEETTPILFGTFHENALNFWKHRNDGHILFLTYENLQKDFKGGIKQIANFIGKTLTEEQVDQIANHCNFESMSKNPMTNYSQGGAAVKTEGSEQAFMRKGKVGDWKNHFTPEMNRKMDAYVAKHFNGTGLEFDYEI